VTSGFSEIFDSHSQFSGGHPPVSPLSDADVSLSLRTHFLEVLLFQGWLSVKVPQLHLQQLAVLPKGAKRQKHNTSMKKNYNHDIFFAGNCPGLGHEHKRTRLI